MPRPKTKVKEPDVYSTGEAARLCGVSQQTIIRCFDNGRLRGYREGASGVRRIPRAALREFMDANAIETAPLERRPRVLVVSSDGPLAEQLREAIGGADGPEIDVATNAWDAGVLTARTRPNLIVLDRAQPGVEARALRSRLRENLGPHRVRVVVIRPPARNRGGSTVERVTKRVRELLGPGSGPAGRPE